MSENYQEPRSADAVTSRTNRQVWVAVGFSVAGLIPLFGFIFGLMGCLCALFAMLGHGYSGRQRIAASAAFLVGALLATFWLWVSTWSFY